MQLFLKDIPQNIHSLEFIMTLYDTYNQILNTKTKTFDMIYLIRDYIKKNPVDSTQKSLYLNLLCKLT